MAKLTADYEVKNNCHLFERFFKVKKKGIFLFGISFFVIEIFTFLYYANEESDDVIDGSSKTVQHSINNISRNIGAVFFKLGTRNVHHKRKRMTPCCHGNTLGPSLFLWKTKYPHFQPFKVTPNLRRCPSEKNSYARRLQGNLHKLYIKRKVIKCTIQ